MTRPKKPTKRKPKPRETSDRVSRIAGIVLESFSRHGLENSDTLMDNVTFMGISLRDLKTLAASCLAQDQTKGKRSKATK